MTDKLKRLLPSFDLIISAFIGGIVLSLMELMSMCTHHENIGDPYFYVGMLIAGFLGIVGLLVSRSKDTSSYSTTLLCISSPPYYGIIL